MGAYVLYASVREGRLDLGLSAAPHVVLSILSRFSPSRFAGLTLLSPPLPLWVAEIALNDARNSSWWRWAPTPALQLWSARLAVHRALIRMGERSAWKSLAPNTLDAPALPQNEIDAAASLLSGRILLEEEVVRLMEEEGEGRFTVDVRDLLEALVCRGDVQRRAAVQLDAVGRWRCRRCGAADKVDVGTCVRCGRLACAACTECAHLGVARACEAVVIVPRREPSHTPRRVGHVTPLIDLEFNLTDAQRRAAQALVEWDGARALVWAACGAGKTEVVYPAIERALQRGDDVLFAVPRRDIAIELGERLRRAFPTVPVKALYGGAPRRFEHAKLTIATTHQVVRFYKRFALVVLDEVDAFPYRGSAMLRHGVERALAADGRLIYMTATPTEELLQTAEAHRWRIVTIPARHHRHPLPEPRFLTLPGIARTQQDMIRNVRQPYTPRELVELIQHLLRLDKPILVFVPTVQLVAPTARLIDSVCRSGAHPGADALPLSYGVHSRDPRRDALREAFVRGEFPVLVATTVLERGITVPAVNVVVLWADYERVFDSATLIQMAGRAGRTREHPDGEVHFVAARANPAMTQAKERIAELNRLAREEGYLIA